MATVAFNEVRLIEIPVLVKNLTLSGMKMLLVIAKPLIFLGLN